jgi:DNA-damage-inducible protein J
MLTSHIVTAVVDPTVQKKAETVLEAAGLTLPDAVRIMLTKIAQDGELPFDPFLPNPTTVSAMNEARSGDLPKASSVEELLSSLNADD